MNASRLINMRFTILTFTLSAEAEVEKPMQDVAGKEGQTCTLTCQLSVPNVKTQWFKNGKLLEPHSRYTCAVANYTQKLSIKDVRPEDQGEYTCTYKNLETTANLWIEGWYRFTELSDLQCIYCKIDHLLTSSIIICDFFLTSSPHSSCFKCQECCLHFFPGFLL